jgi:predicted nucleotidyltransferase
MTQKPDSIIQIDIPFDMVREICLRYQVGELALFGSVLRKDFRNDSDVDMLVEFKPDAQVGFLALLRMQRELAAIFQRPVDLVSKAGLKPKIRQEVLSNMMVLYAS